MKPYMTTLRTSISHSFRVDYDKPDGGGNPQPLAKGLCAPKADGFVMNIGNATREVELHLNWSEWDRLVQHIEALREQAKLEVTFTRPAEGEVAQ